MNRPTDRRQRRREATAAEIKAAAREQLVTYGPTGISLRAVAREVGMSAPALYRYFPSLEALVVGLCVDLYTELREFLLTEADRHDDDLTKLVVAARSFRTWAVTHRPEFALMFASLIPGAVIAKPGCAASELDPEAEPYASMLRFSQVFGDLITRVYQQPDAERGFAINLPALPPLTEGLRAEILRCAEAIGIEAPIEFAYAFHSYWVRLYGLVAMEVFGQLPVIEEAEAHFDAELSDMATRLGVPVSTLDNS